MYVFVTGKQPTAHRTKCTGNREKHTFSFVLVISYLLLDAFSQQTIVPYSIIRNTKELSFTDLRYYCHEARGSSKSVTYVI